jgi:hypothetical protein
MTENETTTAVAPETEAQTKKPFKAYAVVPTGNENLWDGHEIECDPATGTYKILRSLVPNTRDIATGRIASTMDGVDGFEYGPGPEAPVEDLPQP